jgi:hypothetical protein
MTGRYRGEEGRVERLNYVRWSGLALMVGGLMAGTFLIISPYGAIAGSAAVLTPAWTVAHNLHFFGGLFLVAGSFALFMVQRQRIGSAGLVAYVVWLTGLAMFVGTGMITAYMFPFMATHAPHLVALDGPLFVPTPMPILPLSTVTLGAGAALFAVVSYRANILPRGASVLAVAGALLAFLPPAPGGPFPHFVLVAGGALAGLAQMWWGYALWRGVPASEQGSAV